MRGGDTAGSSRFGRTSESACKCSENGVVPVWDHVLARIQVRGGERVGGLSSRVRLGGAASGIGTKLARMRGGTVGIETGSHAMSVLSGRHDGPAPRLRAVLTVWSAATSRRSRRRAVPVATIRTSVTALTVAFRRPCRIWLPGRCGSTATRGKNVDAASFPLAARRRSDFRYRGYLCRIAIRPRPPGFHRTGWNSLML